jgi:hypothetical protein
MHWGNKNYVIQAFNQCVWKMLCDLKWKERIFVKCEWDEGQWKWGVKKNMLMWKQVSMLGLTWRWNKVMAFSSHPLWIPKVIIVATKGIDALEKWEVGYCVCVCVCVCFGAHMWKKCT